MTNPNRLSFGSGKLGILAQAIGMPW